MGKVNELGHTAENLDIREVCDNLNSLRTHDHVPIKKICISNIDPTTTYRSLVSAFGKFGKVVQCILKKQKKYKRLQRNRIQVENQNQEQNQEQQQDEEDIENNSIMKSYAFITYKSDIEARAAVEAGYNRKIRIEKQYLRVIPANSWHQPDHPDYRNKTCDIWNYKTSKINLNAELPETPSFRLESGELNNDCLRYIINLLPFVDRVRAERVCRRWKAVSQDAWHDQHLLNFYPAVWGLKSAGKEHSRSPDACSVYRILKKCSPFITHIDLSTSSQLGNSTLIQLANMCSSMEYINLTNFKYKHSGLKALATTCFNLKSIKIGYNDDKDKFDTELSSLFSRNKNLEKVDIDCFTIEGDCLNHLPKKSMQELYLNNTNYIMRDGFYKVLKKMPNLRVIQIIGSPRVFDRYDDFIKCLYPHPKLEVLEIPVNQNSDSLFAPDLNFSGDILKPLTNLKNLTLLNLKGNIVLDDNFLILLAENCKNLTSIDISDCPKISDLGLDSITSLPKLEYLCMEALTNVTDIVFLKKMRNIKTLLCSNCTNLQSFGLVNLIESDNELETLDLKNCVFINNYVVAAVMKRRKPRSGKCLNVNLIGTSTLFHKIRVEPKKVRVLFYIEPEVEKISIFPI